MRVTRKDISNRLAQEPFRSFRIHLLAGDAVEVTQPAMTIVGLNSAVITTRFGKDSQGRTIADRWRTISYEHMTQLVELTST